MPEPGHLRSLEISENIHLFPAPDPDSSVTPGHGRRKGLAVIGIIVVAGVLGNVALWRSSEARPSPPALPVTAAVSPQVIVAEPEQRHEAPATAAAVPEIAPLPEMAHVEIKVHQPQANLVLDGRSAGANQLKVEVPKDDGEHEIMASAPGYLPFKRTVSFAQDILLAIDLQKMRAGALPRRKAEVKNSSKRTDDSGMSPRPAAKRPMSNIDESDPYAP